MPINATIAECGVRYSAELITAGSGILITLAWSPSLARQELQQTVQELVRILGHETALG